ncbi:MAG: LysR family transcriptional regulator [Lactobacillus sp.]|jgi:DNA-binding transcriptional LysR family regulator|uniref:LysR family transcriptional regulator n=1 Tax=Lacticaseibacillus suilingensis TaxID=2799577 RepID=A0ABW4BF02_9LACO|nr:LysR family transcriptional regulator [Lacticaseibacillus suilingensis]MCI1893552.1 LysR family transcriptional regulator [Lactobacillus sp.]MCI1916778.1 LysR family transcriptional regulator [Lactobacillus sp.]MCI1940941.1 LysR family transcriptional regulator [Lactobacillus sp.]MCI1971586.1 LysR family transcriptional regulator [Lactobacillus sp.]MCI2016083.1 LysR family transcriptional regulator [Lactobacillus sp.]
MSNFSYQVFRAVVEKGTFIQAAASLNVTPSAVSHSVSQLETDLGFPLFIRNRTGVALTPDGAKVLPTVQAILNLEDQLAQIADNINGLNTGRVRLGAFSSVSTNWLPGIIQAFKRETPAVAVSVMQGGFNEIGEQVRTGAVDIGFSLLPVAEANVVPLLKDPIYCITPRDFVPQNGKTMTDADMAKRSFILQQGDYDRDTKAALDRYQVSTNSLVYSVDDQSILSMVEAGLGWGVLPKLALQKLTGDVNIYPFSEPFARTLCLVTNPTTQKSPSVAHMLTVIQTFIQTNYPDNLLPVR